MAERTVGSKPAGEVEQPSQEAFKDLLRATRKGKLAAMRQALAAGADPMERGEAGMTALMVAAVGNRAACVKLLAAISDVEARDEDGLTPFRLAAGSHSWRALKALEGVADAQALDRWGRDALMAAASQVSLEGIQNLLPRIPASNRDGQGRGALEHWLENYSSEIDDGDEGAWLLARSPEGVLTDARGASLGPLARARGLRDLGAGIDALVDQRELSMRAETPNSKKIPPPRL